MSVGSLRTRMPAVGYALVCALACSQPAWADPPALPPLSPDAQAHLDAGISAYAAKQYERAIEELSAAYSIQPRRDVLFAWAQAERLSGDCPSAITLYRRFLTADPPADEKEQATDQLSRCERAIATSPEPRPEPAPIVAPPPRAAPSPLPAPPIERETVSPWYTDVLGDALVVTGGAALGIGAGFFAAAAASNSAASDAATYPEFLEHVDDAGTQRLVGAIGVAAGGALCALGILRFATRSKGGTHETRVGVAVRKSGPLLSVAGSL